MGRVQRPSLRFTQRNPIRPIPPKPLQHHLLVREPHSQTETAPTPPAAAQNPAHSPRGTTPNKPSLILNSSPASGRRNRTTTVSRSGVSTRSTAPNAPPFDVITVPSDHADRISKRHILRLERPPIMKPHPIPQMKHPRPRIRLLPPASPATARSLIVLILPHQPIKNQRPQPAPTAHPSPPANPDYLDSTQSAITTVPEPIHPPPATCQAWRQRQDRQKKPPRCCHPERSAAQSKACPDTLRKSVIPTVA